MPNPLKTMRRLL